MSSVTLVVGTIGRVAVIGDRTRSSGFIFF